MTYKYNIFFICTLMLSLIACSNDDDDTPVSVPENDRTEQQVVDNDSLVDYLNTHYYNATEVSAISNPTVADVVITDPPRDGMHADVVQQLIKLAPKRIVYISCNSATQARDLNLMKSHYEVLKSQAVDMFPQTHHVENVVLLEKR